MRAPALQAPRSQYIIPFDEELLRTDGVDTLAAQRQSASEMNRERNNV
jgi:hypothetical protein